MRFLLLILVAIMLVGCGQESPTPEPPTSTPVPQKTPTHTPVPESILAITREPTLMVFVMSDTSTYKSPGATYDLSFLVHKNDRLFVTGKVDGWLRIIRVDGKEAWIEKSFVAAPANTTMDMDDVPFLEDVRVIPPSQATAKAYLQATANASSPTRPTKAPPCTCSGNLNCSDFPTQNKAQSCFDYCGPVDVHGLDTDNDGVVCESLP